MRFAIPTWTSSRAGCSAPTRPRRPRRPAQSASLIQTEENSNGLLATKFLKRFQLQTKLQELLEQAGMRWSTHRLVNTCLVAFVAGWALGWVLLPDQFRRFAYVPALAGGRASVAVS